MFSSDFSYEFRIFLTDFSHFSPKFPRESPAAKLPGFVGRGLDHIGCGETWWIRFGHISYSYSIVIVDR